MSPAHWGPPTWILFHTIAEQINESYFPDIATQLFHIIQQICNALPCPDCASHATAFLKTVRMNTIQTKNDFRMMLYVFHCKVSERKKKPLFPVADLEKYKTVHLHTAFTNFVKEYTRRQSSFKLMTTSAVRERTTQMVAQWFSQNISKFN